MTGLIPLPCRATLARDSNSASGGEQKEQRNPAIAAAIPAAPREADRRCRPGVAPGLNAAQHSPLWRSFDACRSDKCRTA